MDFDAVCERFQQLAQSERLHYTLDKEGGLGKLYTNASGNMLLVAKRLQATYQFPEGLFRFEFDPQIFIDQAAKDVPEANRPAYIESCKEKLVAAMFPGAILVDAPKMPEIKPKAQNVSPLEAIKRRPNNSPLVTLLTDLLIAGEIRVVKNPQGTVVSVHATPDATVQLRAQKVNIPRNDTVEKTVQEIIRSQHLNTGTHNQVIKPQAIVAAATAKDEATTLRHALSLGQSLPTLPRLQQRKWL